MKRTQMLTTFLLIFILASSVRTPKISASNSNSVNQDLSLETEKVEVIEVKYSPQGELLSKVVKVNFEVYNNGSSSAHVTIRDRVESVYPNTVTMLYGTPDPTKIIAFGNTSLITWSDVIIEAYDRIEYQYIAETWRKLPVTVNETVYVNENQTDLKRIGEIFTLDANVSDTLTIQVNIRNVVQQLFTGRKGFTPPVSCTISMSFSKDYFSNIITSPEANSTSTLGDKSIVTWIILLDDTVTLNLSTKVKEVSSWGEVAIEPLSIQIRQISATMETKVEQSIDALDDTIEMMGDFSNILEQFSVLAKRLGRLANEMASMVDELKSQIDDLKEEKYDLEDLLLFIQNQKPPHNIEAYGINAPYNHEVKVNLEKHKRTTSFAQAQWAVESVEVINTGNNTEIINGLAIQVYTNQTVLKPIYALVLYNEKWQVFKGDLAQLGLVYTTQNNSSYIWPRTMVNSSDRVNVLRDWAGRPIKLIYESDDAPEVNYLIDVEVRCSDVKVEPTDSEIIYSINQPHILAQHHNFSGYMPPSSSNDNDKVPTLIDDLQSWIIPSFVIVSFIAIGALVLRRRNLKEISSKKEKASKEAGKTKILLAEINRLEKTLTENKKQN